MLVGDELHIIVYTMNLSEDLSVNKELFSGVYDGIYKPC